MTSLPLVSEFLPTTGSALSREWVLTDVADNTQLATSQRLKAKLQKILATRTVAATGDGRGEESDRRVREAESRARQAESRIREVEREKEVSEQRAATRIREAESKVKHVHMYVAIFMMLLSSGLAREFSREAERRIGEMEREREVSDQRAATRIREAEGTYRAA